MVILNYNQPELEAEFIVLTIDSIATAKLKGSLENEQEMLTFLKSKYQI